MIVRLKECWNGKYSITFDLEAIEQSCGVKIKDVDTNTWYVDLSIPQTKKIFKFIYQHADDNQIAEVDEFMINSKNKKMVKAWLDTARKYA